jgi:hypothetical protein
LAEIRKMILELSEHLGNIAGFCDADGKRRILIVTNQIFGVSMLDTGYLIAAISRLTAVLPLIVGIQVNYNRKPPFRVVGLNIDLKGKFGAVLSR